jgi:hypothetical protein
MSEIDGLRERVEVARREYAALPVLGWGELGSADPSTGERWDRSHVLGHVSEMLPYWTLQVRGVLGGAGAMGRDQAGGEARRAAVDGGRETGEEALLARVDAGLAGLLALLADMRDADLDRVVSFRSADGERDRSLREVMATVLVGHAEEHLHQLGEGSS